MTKSVEAPFLSKMQSEGGGQQRWIINSILLQAIGN
jgi:hypothetical protein